MKGDRVSLSLAGGTPKANDSAVAMPDEGLGTHLEYRYPEPANQAHQIREVRGGDLFQLDAYRCRS
jgi:hypothetical protein